MTGNWSGEERATNGAYHSELFLTELIKVCFSIVFFCYCSHVDELQNNGILHVPSIYTGTACWMECPQYHIQLRDLNYADQVFDEFDHWSN